MKLPANPLRHCLHQRVAAPGPVAMEGIFLGGRLELLFREQDALQKKQKISYRWTDRSLKNG
jgi:hypothetical protein